MDFNGMLFTCTQSTKNIHIPVYMIIIHISVSDYCIIYLLKHLPFIFYSTIHDNLTLYYAKNCIGVM